MSSGQTPKAEFAFEILADYTGLAACDEIFTIDPENFVHLRGVERYDCSSLVRRTSGSSTYAGTAAEWYACRTVLHAYSYYRLDVFVTFWKEEITEFTFCQSLGISFPCTLNTYIFPDERLRS